MIERLRRFWRGARSRASALGLPNLAHASRWWSMRLSLLGILIQLLALVPAESMLGLWNMMPGEVRALVPVHLATWIGLALFAAVLVARVIPQQEKSDGR